MTDDQDDHTAGDGALDRWHCPECDESRGIETATVREEAELTALERASLDCGHVVSPDDTVGLPASAIEGLRDRGVDVEAAGSGSV